MRKYPHKEVGTHCVHYTFENLSNFHENVILISQFYYCICVSIDNGK